MNIPLQRANTGVRGGERRNAVAIGLINLIYNLARYEQIVWSKLRPQNSA
jgi:hypothetical protein